MLNRDDMMRLFDEKRAMTEERVRYGIEQNRKGYCRILLCDKEGVPASGAKIKAIQKTHEFRFGVNIFMLDELETGEKNERYKEYVKNLFNMATVPFYWNTLEPEKGKQRYAVNSPKIYRRPAVDLCLDFCEENGIEPREHGLAYEFFFPEWLKGKTTFEVKTELSRRMKEIAERYGKKIRTMEITNEMHRDVCEGITEFYREDDYVEWCFKEAERYMSSNQLAINEWTSVWERSGLNRDIYYMEIERAILKGARIDAIAMQYHAFRCIESAVKDTRKLYDPEQLFGIMDRYSNFGLPLQISEVSIPAYTAEQEDEELQAELVRTLYSIWFSHKNVEQVIYWNLADGYAAFAKQGDMSGGENYYRSGLVRFDFTKKPAYHVLEKLIKEEWHTETEIVTDNDGKAEFKGFYGKYEIETVHNGEKFVREIDFGKKSDRNIKIVL